MKNKFFNLFSTKKNFNNDNQKEANIILSFITNNIDNISKNFVLENSDLKSTANKYENDFLSTLYNNYKNLNKKINWRCIKSLEDEFNDLISTILISILYVVTPIVIYIVMY